MTTDCRELSREFKEFNIPPAECCGKNGVVCGNDRVTRLEWPGDGTRPKLARAMPDISKLNFLEYLDLSQHDLTGEFPSYLYGFTRLQEMHLNRNKFTGQLKEDIGNLKNIRVLSVFENKLTGSAPSSIGNLGNLNTLQLQQNLFTGPIPSSFGQLQSVAVMDLSRCAFSGTIPSQLGSLQNLEQLYINENQLTGTVPSGLFTLPKLSYFNLYQNSLYGEISDGVRRVNPTVRLGFNDNYFSGDFPADVKVSELHIAHNCFTSVAPGLGDQEYNQKSKDECEAFIRSLPTSTPNPTPNPTQTSPNDSSSLSSTATTGTANPSTSGTITSQPTSNPTDINNTGKSPTPSTSGSPQANTSAGDSGSSSSASTGPIIGAVAGVLVAIFVACTIAYMYMKRKRNQKDANDIPSFQNNSSNSNSNTGLTGGAGTWNELQEVKSGLPHNANSAGSIQPFPISITSSKDGMGGSASEQPMSVYPASIPKSVEAGYPSTQTTLFPPTRQPTIVEKQKQEESGWPIVTPTNTILQQPTDMNNIVVMPQQVDEYTKQPIAPPRFASPGQAFIPQQHQQLQQQRHSPPPSKSSYNPNSQYLPTPSSHRHTASIEEASTWSPSQVAQWLESVDVSPRLAVILKENGVTGYHLLVMTEERLLEMGIELPLSRRMIMEAVEMLRVGNGGSGSGARDDVVVPAAPPQYYG
ncbi:hypothetical protein HDU97_002136 [Phlyctochytrium planicorne]|nr:hypothetical protein HDU97_002136 [Phlyctochytrium planicorne]